MKNIGKFNLVDSLLVVSPSGQIYREVNEADLASLGESGSVVVFAIKTAGLEYVSDIGYIFERVNFLNPAVENGLVQFTQVFTGGESSVGNGGRLMTTVRVDEFTGSSRAKGQIPEILYLTPVVPKNNMR